MTDLAERLDRFMARANAIYYATHDPFADFTTSPEISQVFGEIIGLWAAVTWQLLGSPGTIALVEAGPGRGTLMADALRAIRQATPRFAGALEVHLIETSPRLRTAQAARVPSARWHTELATVPDMPIILLANEFLDALPIRQFVRRGAIWVERYVEAGRFLERPADQGDLPRSRLANDGDIVELNEPARDFVRQLAIRLGQRPGAGLLLDYGSDGGGTGSSLQAIADKRPVNPLSPPGSADLTAHVDFADLARIARENAAAVQGPQPQGSFLTALGLFQRAERLAFGRPDDEAAALFGAARRLTESSAMGQLFKVMAVCSPTCPPLPGLS